MKRRLLNLLAGALVLAAGLLVAQAQWVTQSVALTNGWNSVFLHVDASHDTVANLVGGDPENPILEVWLWAPPPSTLQFVQSPQLPVESGNQWVNWMRLNSEGSTLQRLIGNAAYLVRVGTNVSTFTWHVKGKPLVPSYDWTTTGLNFIGFPTVPVGAPDFESYFANSPELLLNAEIYQYRGGDLGPGNPSRVFALRTVPVTRGRAFWIRSGTHYNRYFSPFEVVISGTRGINFRDTLNASSFRLRNLTPTNLTVTAILQPSETPPVGQPALAGVPPLLLRGALNTTTLTYGYTNVPTGAPRTWMLAPRGQPGSEVEVVLGLNRAAMTQAVGETVGGVWVLTDSLGHAQVGVPVTATMASSAGLWVGTAHVTQVGQYLATFDRDSTDKPVVGPDGRYVISGVNTNLGSVARPFPLRLIVHNPESGHAVLLQRAYIGPDAQTNLVVARQESALNRSLLREARRVSSTHLPWTSDNTAWSFNGTLHGTTNLATTVNLAFNEGDSSPFLHTYHPDHDNLDSRFAREAPQGAESYSVRRDIRLGIRPPAVDASDFRAGEQDIQGDYEETVTVLGLARAGGSEDSRVFTVRGAFTLHRVSNVPNLTGP